MRRCLDCDRLLTTGSRCHEHQAAYRSSYSRHEWAAQVKQRAGYRCEQCGSYDRVVADHVLPLSQGGADTLANGRALCQTCHREKHSGGQAA
jgi:5-methylcytosine-specific restriction endonuclease McrA